MAHDSLINNLSKARVVRSKVTLIFDIGKAQLCP